MVILHCLLVELILFRFYKKVKTGGPCMTYLAGGCDGANVGSRTVRRRRNTKKERKRCGQTVSLNLTDRCTIQADVRTNVAVVMLSLKPRKQPDSINQGNRQPALVR